MLLQKHGTVSSSVLALLLFRMDKSIEDFDKAIGLDSQNSIIYSNRGLVNRKLERFEKAIEDYGNEIKYGPPSNIKAFNNRAYCFAKLGQY
jgi:tetratricopeptide (TPR) repeat protein